MSDADPAVEALTAGVSAVEVPAVEVPTVEVSAIHALLVGIDAYLPLEFPGATAYPPLSGAVADVRRMEIYLREVLHVPAAHLEVLTASLTEESEEPAEDPADWPTYERLLTAFEALDQRASAGDQVLIHYSGHGGQATSQRPEKRRRDWPDECIVPVDIGHPGARYVRDWEIGLLVHRLARRGRLVTLVLDCCHSGGLTRARRDGEALRVRGVGRVDRAQRRPSLLEPSREEEAALEGALGWGGEDESSGALLMELAPGRGRQWLPLARGATLLAACHPFEKAVEHDFDGSGPSGALTYWLLDALQRGGALTYRSLYQRLLNRIHGRFPSQTPILEGDAARRFLGRERIPRRVAFSVLAGPEDLGEGKILLNGGALHGLRPGARLSVHPADGAREAVNESGEATPVRVRLISVEATRSVGEVEGRPGRAPRAGDRARLRSPGELTLRRDVAFAAVGAADSPEESETRRSLWQALDERGSGFLHRTSEATADGFEVRLEEDGRLQIYDPAGEPLPGQRPILSASEKVGPAAVVERLIHLAKFFNVRELRNDEGEMPLRGRLGCRLAVVPEGWNGSSLVELVDSSSSSSGGGFGAPVGERSRVEIEPGTEVGLRIFNGWQQPLNIAVLDLRPDWSIGQIHPASSSFEALEPGRALDLYVDADLPEGVHGGMDVFLVFAAAEPFDLQPLELPALGESHRLFRGCEPHPEPGSLNALFAALTAHEPRTRGQAAAPRTASVWWVEQRELTIRRGATGS